MVNPFSSAHTNAEFATRSAKLDKGRVTQVKSHERGDKIAHYAKVRIKQDEVEETAPIVVREHGDVNVPEVNDYVVVGYMKGERPFILGQYYPVEDSMEGILKNYTAGERIVGHSSTDASVLFEENGDILSINSYGMNGGRLENGDIRDHDGNFHHLRGPDQFIHPADDGNVYGVGEPHIGVLQAPDTEGTTQYVNVGFQPRQVQFEGQLHQMKYNEPYYTSEDSGGDRNGAMAESNGHMTLTPLAVDSDVEVNGSLDSTSTTDPRTEHEPYTDAQLSNPTQHVRSKAWFSDSGTDHRSYVGDGQVLRLIQGSDASMTEKGRVEARVTDVDNTGFELEWFMNDEPNATWLSSTEVNPIVEFTAYT